MRRLARVAVVPAVGALLLLSSSGGCHGKAADAGMGEPRPELHPPLTLGAGFVDLTDGVARSTRTKMAPLVRPLEPEMTAGLWADLDGDGTAEALLTHTDVGELDPAETDPTPGAEVYRYDAATAAFVPDTRYLLDPKWRLCAALDLDDDGHPDLLLLRSIVEVVWGAAAGAPLGLAQRLDDPNGRPGNSAILSVGLDDLDGDGWLDLVLASTQGDLHPLLRSGPRAFRDRRDLVPSPAHGGVTAVYAGSFGAGDKMLVSALQPMSATPGQSVFEHRDGEDEGGYPRFAAFNPVPAGASFLDGKIFLDLGSTTPMGFAAADIDGDGVLDFAASLDPVHALLRGQADGPFIDRTRATWYDRITADSGLEMIPWGVAFVDLDLDGRPDAIDVHGNDVSAWWSTDHVIGPQHATVHWNGGDFHFADITPLTHLDRRGQFRALSVGDLEGDGDADLIVGGQHELPRLYRNDIDAGNHGFSLRLHGTSSNHLGVGARVDVTVVDGSAPKVYFVTAIASPNAVSEPLLFVGLGPATSAARVRVTWPSGTVQDVLGLAAGALHRVEEPPVFAVDPPSRHVLADGKSLATLHVTPRNPDGSVRPGAHVSVSVTHGPRLVIADPVADARGGFTITVVAPAAPGSARLEIRVDGAALPLHPRLWFD